MYIYVIVSGITMGEYTVEDRTVDYVGPDARKAYAVGLESWKSECVTEVECQVWKDGEHQFDVEVK
jgi:hypothetical protein